MADWHCFKCKEEMRETELTVNYMDVEDVVEGLGCPKCGAKYITEETAVGQLTIAENMMDGK